MLDIKKRYFYLQLNTVERAVYEAMYDGVLKRKPIFPCHTTGADMGKVAKAIDYDCPELFHVRDWALSYSASGVSLVGKDCYAYTPAEEREIRRKLEEIVQNFPVTPDEFSRELAVHNYLVRNCTYDKNYRSRMPGTKAYLENFNMVGPLLRGVGVCDGFSRAAQYLLTALDVTAIHCVGEVTGEAAMGGGITGHAWVIVKIDGDYYHLDVSHDVCLSENVTIPRYSYFNVTDREIAADHRFEAADYPGVACRSTRLNYHVKYNRYFTGIQPLKAAMQAFLGKLNPYDRTRRFDFRVSSGISADQVTSAVTAVMNWSPRVTGYSYVSGGLNTYSVEFKLNEAGGGGRGNSGNGKQNGGIFGGFRWPF